MSRSWVPSLGAVYTETGTSFHVWAPDLRQLELCLETDEGLTRRSLHPQKNGMWSLDCSDVKAGQRYRFRLDEDRTLPDPASRFQPEGVHGPSQVINPHVFQWDDHDWQGVNVRAAILYELHVGTFSEEGTFSGVEKRLHYLADLGITAMELMPVADFPGLRNWGYDGVSLFAPSRCYGTPDDLRSLVNAAHAHGIAVILDVVYNHFGPDGAYAPSFSPDYFTDRYKTAWGDAINFDGPRSSFVREFFIENALYWLHEFHIDGFRLDATHAIRDSSPSHFVEALTRRIREAIQHRKILLFAEDHRNMANVVRSDRTDGWGMDAVWSDDFHHVVRRHLAADQDGYYQDYKGSTTELAMIIQDGWLFTGQYSNYYKRHRGTDPAGLLPENFVFFLQNHDQIGNRAFGERLNHQVDPASFRAASTLLMLAPQIPLLFMGQEYGADTPFLYFTHHKPDLGRNVRKGRLREFQRFTSFVHAASDIPDPQSLETFLASQLNWRELHSNTQSGLFQLYRSLIRIRNLVRSPHHIAAALAESSILLEYKGGERSHFILVLLKGERSFQIPATLEVLMTTEDSEFCTDPIPIQLPPGEVIFSRPGAIVAQYQSPGSP